MSSANLLLGRQSGFQPGHSTETAVLRVLSDILLTVDSGETTVLILLDLFAAFDTVNHDILLSAYRSLSVLTTSLSSSFNHTCWDDHSTYNAEMLSQLSPRLCAVYCLSCTLRI